MAAYFNFTRKDRIAVITILLLIVVVFFLPEAMPRNGFKPIPADTSWIAALEKIEKQEAENKTAYERSDEDNMGNYQYDRPSPGHNSRPKGKLFYFDPNTLTEPGWKKLGFRDKTIRTILNYLSKGGKFRKPEDLQRIYGLFPDEYERIAPYIKIEPAGEADRKKDFTGFENGNNPVPKSNTSRYTVVDINSADTTALIALPGIGSKLAARIINFRDKLGGFYTVEQVGETFGLPDSTFQKIKQWLKLENTSIRKININTATLDELKTHPYIRYALANPIIAYRNEHGLFVKPEDLKKVMAVTDAVFKKILPYLTIEK